MRVIVRFIAVGLLASCVVLGACTTKNSGPVPSVPSSATSTESALAANDQIRVVASEREQASPSPRVEQIFLAVMAYVSLRPNDFGGTFVPNFDPGTVRIWVVSDEVWQQPDFQKLRQKEDPQGTVIVREGIGASLTSLKETQKLISDRFFKTAQGKVARVTIDNRYDAVRVVIRFQRGDPDLNAMSLVQAIFALSPNTVFQSEGSDTSGA